MGTTTSTASGRVEGIDKDGVVQFRGIPYAAPPVGVRRWLRPAPAEPWTGARDCSAYGPIAPQNGSPIESMAGAGSRPMSEDCLTLNIWTPACDERARPVMVWLHGGGFTSGTGSIAWYNGARLASVGDVVVVSVNYRLGALGWLHLQDLLGDEFAGSGNCGLLDQIAALEWVRDNIAGFGGDPGRVTLFGESAGGMSIGTMLGTPAAAGLFRAAIPQSGAAHNAVSADRAAWVAMELTAELGLPPGSAEALLALPLERLLPAQAVINERVLLESVRKRGRAMGGLGLAFQPVVDGVVLPRAPLAAIRDGAAAGVALMAGTTRDEFTLFHLVERQRRTMTEERLHRRAEILLDANGDGSAGHAIEVYRRNRPGADVDDLWVAMGTDWAFRIPAIRLAEAQSAHQPATFMYEFSYPSTAWGGLLRASHAVDIPFVFDNLHRGGVELLLGPVEESTRTLAGVTSGAWLAFARAGSPAHEGLPGWPAYETGSRATMELGPDRLVHRDLRGDERELWAGVL